ncbi:uncharacterized protein VNE69_03216 [Vairimorpha necatrix]|uniref:Uncharacterized protein n=1 Tax=Vairimorpha necatrix TaxID=6039 RepID=A0AAX4JAI4_9MICR
MKISIENQIRLKNILRQKDKQAQSASLTKEIEQKELKMLKNISKEYLKILEKCTDLKNIKNKIPKLLEENESLVLKYKENLIKINNLEQEINDNIFLDKRICQIINELEKLKKFFTSVNIDINRNDDLYFYKFTTNLCQIEKLTNNLKNYKNFAELSEIADLYRKKETEETNKFINEYKNDNMIKFGFLGEKIVKLVDEENKIIFNEVLLLRDKFISRKMMDILYMKKKINKIDEFIEKFNLERKIYIKKKQLNNINNGKNKDDSNNDSKFNINDSKYNNYNSKSNYDDSINNSKSNYDDNSKYNYDYNILLMHFYIAEILNSFFLMKINKNFQNFYDVILENINELFLNSNTTEISKMKNLLISIKNLINLLNINDDLLTDTIGRISIEYLSKLTIKNNKKEEINIFIDDAIPFIEKLNNSEITELFHNKIDLFVKDLILSSNKDKIFQDEKFVNEIKNKFKLRSEKIINEKIENIKFEICKEKIKEIEKIFKEKKNFNLNIQNYMTRHREIYKELYEIIKIKFIEMINENKEDVEMRRENAAKTTCFYKYLEGIDRNLSNDFKNVNEEANKKI